MNELRPHIPSRIPEPVSSTEVVDVSVIIVNYNVREFLDQAIRSVLRAAADLSVEVFVVDNDSADGSAAMVREQFPDVQLIANEANVGFSRANNQAIRAASGRYLLILNPDTILQEDTLSRLTAFLDAHPDAGAVGCQILNPDGTFAPESRRAFPTPEVAFYRISGLSRLFPRSPRFGRYNMTFLPRDEVAEVDALSGSCMLVRHAALYYSSDEARTLGFVNGRSHGTRLRSGTPGRGAGLFDEEFFMYGEDLDWCYRIQQAGWKIFYTPETRIIHYKGESTKKGELRYVRLFYGAMLKFAEKHIESRYSWILTSAIRGAILGRAFLTMVSQMARRIAHPAVEFLLVFLIVSVLGVVVLDRSADALPPLFFASVAGGFAALYTIACGLAGGYRPGQRRRLHPVWRGATIAFVLLAALSFFAKDIAFSRILLVASYGATWFGMSVLRLSMRRPRANGDCRVLLVGSAREARRLEKMLSAQPDPPFILVGHVYDETTGEATGGVGRRLGPLRQLRDIVRLHRIDDVVFASRCISNQQMFHVMQQLHDLPLHFRILTEGPDRVIGKASINDFAQPPLVEVSRALRSPRSRTARRSFEIPLAIVGTLLHPLVLLAGWISGRPQHLRRLAERTRNMPQVLVGRLALVGYDADLPYEPPAEWGLRPGLFSVTDTVGRGTDRPDDLRGAYWFYMQNQSASMDWDIMWKSLRSGDD